MKTFRGASLVAVRCSSALCFLLLPPYLIQQQRGHQLLTRGKQQPLLAAGRRPTMPSRCPPTTSVTFTPPSSLDLRPARTSTASLLGQAAHTSDALETDDENNSTVTTESSISSRSNNNSTFQEEEKAGRLRRIQRRAAGRMRAFVEGSRSLLNRVRAREQTAMEAAAGGSLFSMLLLPPTTTRRQNNNTTTKNATQTMISRDDTTNNSNLLPQGPRWAIAHPSTDLSGTWKPIITKEFQRNYDDYLERCGTNYYFRKVCLAFCGTTRETIQQQDGGRVLRLTGTSPAGEWDRSLLSSGADVGSRDNGDDDGSYEEVYATFLDPDKEMVQVEAWWEDQGTIHTSFLRDKPGVCGGAFESRRYLDVAPDGTRELVCESTFHPAPADLESAHTNNGKFRPAFIQWRYRRQDDDKT